MVVFIVRRPLYHYTADSAYTESLLLPSPVLRAAILYLRRWFFNEFKKIGNAQNLDVAVAAKPQQVAITCDDKARTCGQSAFDDPVIIRVVGNHIKRLRWMHERSATCQ